MFPWKIGAKPEHRIPLDEHWIRSARPPDSSNHFSETGMIAFSVYGRRGSSLEVGSILFSRS
ncbi:hypothetical protein [Leptospira gomenensis]|uniref:hypothetical protein n=1 Tax=Leptospira gomenensis TaxID=2484974 RepID=UPI0010843B61|nr:hypothetical protein [Leptospira gomenensis]